MRPPRRIVIVGGGIAGWTVASGLRDGGFDGSITLVEREPACYDRPPLSKDALAADVPLSDLAFADAGKLAARGIVAVNGRTVVELDRAAMTVALDDGSRLAADRIVLATGADARPPAFPGGDLPGVHTLRTYADARAVRALGGRSILVVGAGFIGAEAAAVLRELGSDVVLVDRNAVPCVTALGPTMARHLHAMHAEHGVDARIGSVSAVAANGDRLTATLADGGVLDVDGVLVGAGVTACTGLAERAGIAVEGGIVVDGAGRTSAPGVFAAGDATRRRRADGTLAECAGHWDAARTDAHAVVAAMLGTELPQRGAPWFWSDRYGHHVEIVGRLSGAGEEVVRPGEHPTVFRTDQGALVGAASVDDPNAVRAARRLIDRGAPVSAAQLADPAVPLRSLLAAA